MVVIRGGNSNNGAICGAFCSNSNNTVSNANWNIGGRAYGRIFFNVNKALYRSKVILFIEGIHDTFKN